MRLILIISLIFGFFSSCLVSAGVDLLEKKSVSGTDSWVKSDVSAPFNLAFLPLGTKPGKRLVYKGAINLDRPIESAEAGNEATHVAVEGNTVNIDALIFEDKVKVKFKDATEREFKIVVTESQFRLFNDQCKNFLINTSVLPTDKKLKIPAFPMGVSCDKYEDKIILVVSIPAEIEGGESSLVEGGGKGEAWKFYELPSTAREDGMIGGIKFSVKNIELNLGLQNIRLKKKEDEPKKELVSTDKSFFKEVTFGFGSKNLSFDAGSVSSASSGIAMDAYLQTKPVWSKFQLAGSYSMALVSAKEDNITFTDFSGFLSYPFQFGKSRIQPFGFAKIVDFLHKATQTRLQATLAGVGLDYRFVYNKNQVSLNFEYGAFAPKSISSQIRYQIGYQYLILEKSKIALGLFYDNQNFKAINTTNDSRSFKEGNILLKAVLISN